MTRESRHLVAGQDAYPSAADPGRSPNPGAVGRSLDAAEDANPTQAVEAVTRELGATLGAEAVSFLIADLSGRALVRLVSAQLGETSQSQADRGEDDPDWLPLDGGPVEQVLSSQETQVLEVGRGSRRCWTVLAPVTERGEALGILEMVLPDPPSAVVVGEIERTAHLLAFVIIANRRHTDLFEVGQRSAHFSLSAEIQRRLLPSAFTCEGSEFTVAAWLEPAADVGGDTFDYTVDDTTLHFSMTDAMGHGVPSALTATLCVGSLRNIRRQGGSLLEQVHAADAALLEQQALTGTEGFATGLVGRVELSSGVLTIVNAGHTEPYLVRKGVLVALHLPVDLPLGMVEGATYESASVQLQPNDRLVVMTDGMVELASGDVDLEEDVLASRDLHPREATREISGKVLALSDGHPRDDAALLVLDWHGPGRHRETSSGAN